MQYHTAGNLFPLIHALGDASQPPTGIRTRFPRLRGSRLTNWAIPPPPTILSQLEYVLAWIYIYIINVPSSSFHLLDHLSAISFSFSTYYNQSPYNQIFSMFITSWYINLCLYNQIFIISLLLSISLLSAIHWLHALLSMTLQSAIHFNLQQTISL